jgi:von Willebrand factor A domain-containing protein 5
MLRIKLDSNSCLAPPAQPAYIPLKRVHIEATIRSFAADVTIKQLFRNEEATPVEAVYCFLIEEQAAIYSFAARIDDREIVTELKECKEVQEENADALRQGDGAYLLEQNKKSQDSFIINVGALPPGKECQISISYVTELQLVYNASKIRFVIPTTIAPRYNPDTSSLTAPASNISSHVQTTPYTIELQCRVKRVGVKTVSSMSHPIVIDLAQQDVYAITLVQENTHLDRDILIDIDLLENRSNTIAVVELGAVMAAYAPTEEDCRLAMKTSETTNEFMFVVNCSGSMKFENKIGLARQAMLLFLKSLPVVSHFNYCLIWIDLYDTVSHCHDSLKRRKCTKS